MKKHEKLLVVLMEECGELTQACSKVIKTRGGEDGGGETSANGVSKT